MDTDTVIIGGGLVGLAIAAERARTHRVLILERHRTPATETSSRNSEVIHAGLYYPPGSLKARLCHDGAQRLYRFCETHGVPHRRCGKLLVATGDADIPALEQLADNARACGVTGLQPLDAAAVQRLEPAVRARAGLLSPDTGIVDSHTLARTLLGLAEHREALFSGASRVERVTPTAGSYVIHGTSVDEPFCVTARTVVNAAGLTAHRVAAVIEGLPVKCVPAITFHKGCYASYSGRAPFTRLVYPLPQPGLTGLGIHATLDLGGQVRFGPDTRPVDDPDDVRVTESDLAAFPDAIRRYFPALEAERLQPGQAGIRPRVAGPDNAPADFVIRHEADAGLPGLVQLFGIESPGLTAALAIAKKVARQLAVAG